MAKKKGRKPLIRLIEDDTVTWVNVDAITCVVDSTAEDEGAGSDDAEGPQALFFMSDRDRPMISATYADNPSLRQILDSLSRDATDTGD